MAGVSDEFASPAPDPEAEALARQLSRLSAEDQALVRALVDRLHRSSEPGELEEFGRDVSFMDFDE